MALCSSRHSFMFLRDAVTSLMFLSFMFLSFLTEEQSVLTVTRFSGKEWVIKDMRVLMGNLVILAFCVEGWCRVSGLRPSPLRPPIRPHVRDHVRCLLMSKHR